MAYSIFKSIKLVNPEIDVSEIFDVIIEDNKINAIVKNFDEVILSDKNPITFYDCNGLTMAPGLVDMTVNIGKTENLKLTEKVASENGITSMVLLPNQTPKLNNPSIIYHIQRQSEDPSLPKVWVYGAATKDDQALQMCELGLMAELGAVGFTNGNKSIKNSLVLRRVMSYAQMINCPIIPHAEDEDLSGLNQASTTSIRGEMNEGEVSTRLGLIGIPSCAEVIMIERDIRLAKLTGVHYHVAHVSTRDGIDVIRKAKKEGVKITCDTAPPYFALNETELLSYNTAFKLSPPLRCEDDRLAVIEGIQDGTIDAIASDHRSRSNDTKIQPFSAASIGASGIETLFLLTLELVHKKIIDLNKAVSLLTTNPSNILNIEKNKIDNNKKATFIVFDENAIGKIDKNNLKTSPTPFHGRKTSGKVLGTFINGHATYIHKDLEEKIKK